MENFTEIENSTLATNLSMDNPTNSTSETSLEDFTTFEIILALFNFFMYILSFISMIIHFVKFFKSKQKQNLQIKNLTNYCGCLFLVYLLISVFIFTDLFSYFPKYFLFLDFYLHLTEAVLLLIMSINTCMCILVSQKAYHVPFSDDRQFLIYSMVGWLLPLFLAILIFVLESYHEPKIISILFFRLLAVVPFSISLWYITKSIGWNRRNIIKNFVIHLRLLILTGMLSVIPNTIYGVLLLFNEDSALTKITGQIADVFYYPEGFIVGLCFTFRKGTFENRNENPIEMTNGYITEVAQVADEDFES